MTHFLPPVTATPDKTAMAERLARLASGVAKKAPARPARTEDFSGLFDGAPVTEAASDPDHGQPPTTVPAALGRKFTLAELRAQRSQQVEHVAPAEPVEPVQEDEHPYVIESQEAFSVVDTAVADHGLSILRRMRR